MLEKIIETILITMVLLYISHSFIDNNLKRLNVIIYSIIMVILLSINSLHDFLIIKLINMLVIYIIIFKYLFNTRIKRVITLPLLFELTYFIINISLTKVMHTKLLIICIVSLFCTLIIFKIKYFKKLYTRIENYILKLNNEHVIILFILSLLLCNFVTFSHYYSNDFLLTIIIVISMIATISTYLYIKMRSEYYKMFNRYNSNILSLRELEQVLNNYRVDNHENKNQLLTIRNMTSNKKVINFIDTILNNRIKDNANIMHETSILPSGGIRGLIYSKMLVMANKNIECELDVEQTIRIVDMKEYSDELLLDICKILGIFLDNAIEEVETLDDKYIFIEMYMEDKSIITSITNTYNHDLDPDDIYQLGYSTKGKNHGYGLSLVRKIINKNDKLNTYHKISDNEFTQILEINRND